jgi:hypothetical protein
LRILRVPHSLLLLYLETKNSSDIVALALACWSIPIQHDQVLD